MLGLCVAAVLLSVSYLDRPAAEFFETHFRHRDAWVYLNRALSPLSLVVVAALFFLIGSGLWLVTGRHLAAWTETPLLCSWSAMWAFGAETVLKAIFGRAWPDPTYIENHLYGFRFFHASAHWSSFPSGTATISAAIAAVVWMRAPRLRVVSTLLTFALLGGVVVTNGHWISDVIAGAFLGATIGWMTVLLRLEACRKL